MLDRYGVYLSHLNALAEDNSLSSYQGLLEKVLIGCALQGCNCFANPESNYCSQVHTRHGSTTVAYS